MHIGFDGGYNAIKAVTEARRVSFPSITGTPDRAKFSLNGHPEELIISVNGQQWLVGEAAIVQSRFVQRREDRAWIESDEYYRLFLAALTELTQASGVEMTIVTGLPIAYFDDKQTLINRLKGEHKTQREGRKNQTFKETNVRVIPQPFRALLSEALDNQGRPIDQALSTGRVAVIDIGGKTTNLLSVNKLADVSKETVSVNVGGWDVVRVISDYLIQTYPGLELRDHQIVEAIRVGQVKYFGQVIDLQPIIDTAVGPMARQIISQAGQLWNSGANLDAVLITGGGAHLLGERIKRNYRHARIVNDPIYANSIGYWKLSQRLK